MRNYVINVTSIPTKLLVKREKKPLVPRVSRAGTKKKSEYPTGIEPDVLPYTKSHA